jgi:Flp pilus assembly protein TadG
MPRPPRTLRARDERGVAALMVAVSFLALLMAGAMVFDFGMVRVDRTSNKLATDAAVTAGTKTLAAETVRKPWLAACAALAYLKVNGPELAGVSGSWSTGSGAAVAGDPCAEGSPLRNLACVPSTASSWAHYSGSAGDGRITVDIATGYVLNEDANFPEDQSLTGDDGAAAAGGCDQLAVVISETETPGLGGLATSDEMVTRVRSVGRVTEPVITQDVPALLLLERHNCLAIDVNGNGPYIKVVGNGAAPGSIHSDSLGDGTSCSSVNKIVNGNTPIPGVLAHKAETGGRPGVITVAALSGAPGAIATNASDPSPVMVNADGQPAGAPTGRALVGRGYADQRFLQAVQATIAAATSTWSSGTTPPGFTKYTGNCNNITGNVPGQLLYFQCANAKFNNATLPAATQIVTSGVLSLGSGNSLSMPVMQRLYVRGGTGIGLDVKGTLQLNHGTQPNPGDPLAKRSCEDYHLVAPTARAKLVVGQGSFTVGGTANVQMCGTSLVMADNTGSPSCPLPLTVTFPGREPYTNGCQGTVSQVGGGNFDSGTIDWSAPNATSSPPTDLDKAELEDLALWTETSSVSSIGGNGSMSVSGVFFAPNADPFKIAGKSSQTNGANAQFISRRLEVNGNGQLTLRPNPNDAVGIPQPIEFGLVR